MTTYEHCLIALERLLSAVGVKYWPERLRQDLEAWKATGDKSSHLSSYGGMGSFNDLGISHLNLHRVTENQEPLANSLFEWIKAVTYYLAKNPIDRVSAMELRSRVGCYDSVFIAFAGGDNVGSEHRGLLDQRRTLNSWRCFRCGFAEVTNSSVNWYVVQSVMPGLVFEACEELALMDLVDKTLRLEIDDIANFRRETDHALAATGISTTEEITWTRPCPKCRSLATRDYGWQLSKTPPMRFEPSDDNLVMSKKITP